MLDGDALAVAPRLLGALLRVTDGEGRVTSLRLTEVEAYLGPGVDPGSHAFRGPTPRNATMFGPAGVLYVYRSYGVHACANIVCGPAGEASAVLLRAGVVEEGRELARSRRVTSRSDVDLARGPGRLTTALGIGLGDDGAALDTGSSIGPGRARFELEPPSAPVARFHAGPRTGVSGEGGGAAFPWRFWIPGDPTVSPYRASLARRAPRAG